MLNVARTSQLHATDSEFGTHCLHEQQFDVRATSLPQSRKLLLTNGTCGNAFRGPYPYCGNDD